MSVYVCLLRGINVAGHKQVKMEELRQLAAEAGHAEVKTYLQSGNLVLRTDISSADVLAGQLQKQIAERMGHDVAVLIRTGEEMSEVVRGNPFVTASVQASELYVTFLAENPGPSRIGNAKVPIWEPDEFVIRGREIYLHCPNGYGRTKLNNALFERNLKITATTRNWNTVTNLAKLAEQL